MTDEDYKKMIIDKYHEAFCAKLRNFGYSEYYKNRTWLRLMGLIETWVMIHDRN